jgi:hypothetical protein
VRRRRHPRPLTCRLERRHAVAEGDDGDGPLMHTVRADERRDRRVRKAGVEGRGQPGGVGHREGLGEHRAHVPVHVSVTALAVLPAGAPRDAGDDECGCLSTRRRPDLHEGVILRVIPVHAGRHLRAFGHGDVQLEREAAARGPGGAEQPGPLRRLFRAHHACGEVEQSREVGQVELSSRDVGGAREHRDGRRRRRRQIARERNAGQ